MPGGHGVKTEHAAGGEGDGEGTPPFQGRWLGLTRILLSATHAWRKLRLQEKMSCLHQGRERDGEKGERKGGGGERE